MFGHENDNGNINMTEWLAVITITLLATVSPGPDFVMVSRNALSLTKRAGILTALGIGMGVFVHVAYTLFGLNIIIHYLPNIFKALKFIGATYLCWLGMKMIFSQNTMMSEDQQKSSRTNLQAFRTGFLTNALNPKTSIFIISLFVQVIQPETSMVTRIAYGSFISLVHVIWFALVAIFFGTAKFRSRIFSVRHWIDRGFGIALILFGLSLMFSNISLT